MVIGSSLKINQMTTGMAKKYGKNNEPSSLF